MDAHHLITVKKNRNIPEFRAGDTVQVNYRVTEGERSRIQPFIGVVIRRTGGTSPAACFTVRHIAKGFGVERTFPIYSPHVESVEIQRYGKVRRAKLFYLRKLSGRAARIKELTVVPEWRKAGVNLPPEEEVAELQEELEAEPVDEAVVEEAATDEAPAKEAVAEATTEEATTDEAPAEEAVAEATTEEATTDEAPAEEAVAETATEEQVAEEAAAEPEEAAAEEATVEEASAEEPVAEEAPAEDAAEEEPATQEPEASEEKTEEEPKA